MTFRGTMNADKTRISVASIKDITILSVAATSQGSLRSPLRSFKVLHMLARFKGTGWGGVTPDQQRSTYSNLGDMWSRCSNNYLTYDTSSLVIGYVDLDNTTGCPSDSLFSQWMRQSQDYARSKGINPADYPYHAFSWPQEIKRNCGWAGKAYVACYNNSNGGTPCRAQYMSPYSASSRILMHETGHNIGTWALLVWTQPCWYCGVSS